MRVFLLHSHPVESSYGAALCRQTRQGLEAAGHEVDYCDLYAEEFDPVLSRHERIVYHDESVNQDAVASYVHRLKTAQALVLVTPIWHFGFPAILKGFFDRVFLPGVSFKLEGGQMQYTLKHITKLAAITTYGADRTKALIVGDPPRRIVKRVIRAQIHPAAKVLYLGQYSMNRTTVAARTRFLAAVQHEMQRF
jgi:putative NADPH-quinone reductase